jgi:hypothetical protein
MTILPVRISGSTLAGGCLDHRHRLILVYFTTSVVRGTKRLRDACFIVRDHDGHALAYVYYENEPVRRTAANLLTHDEARRIAAPLKL